ncbi:hypothetical protein GPN2_14333 [Streptomyces murinus]
MPRSWSIHEPSAMSAGAGAAVPEPAPTADAGSVFAVPSVAVAVAGAVLAAAGTTVTAPTAITNVVTASLRFTALPRVPMRMSLRSRMCGTVLRGSRARRPPFARTAQRE